MKGKGTTEGTTEDKGRDVAGGNKAQDKKGRRRQRQEKGLYSYRKLPRIRQDRTIGTM